MREEVRLWLPTPIKNLSWMEPRECSSFFLTQGHRSQDMTLLILLPKCPSSLKMNLERLKVLKKCKRHSRYTSTPSTHLSKSRRQKQPRSITNLTERSRKIPNRMVTGLLPGSLDPLLTVHQGKISSWSGSPVAFSKRPRTSSTIWWRWTSSSSLQCLHCYTHPFIRLGSLFATTSSCGQWPWNSGRDSFTTSYVSSSFWLLTWSKSSSNPSWRSQKWMCSPDRQSLTTTWTNIEKTAIRSVMQDTFSQKISWYSTLRSKVLITKPLVNLISWVVFTLKWLWCSSISRWLYGVSSST